MLACYVLTLSGLYVRCLASAIHEMTTINKTTAKLDHVPFTCNWFMKLRKWAHRCMLLQKIFSKISANFSNCESISKKGLFLKLVNVFWKRTLPQFVFYIVTLISSKLWKFPVHSLIRRDSHFQLFHSLIRRDFSFSFDFS